MLPELLISEKNSGTRLAVHTIQRLSCWLHWAEQLLKKYYIDPTLPTYKIGRVCGHQLPWKL